MSNEYSRVVKGDSVWATCAVKVVDSKAYIIAIMKDAQGNPLPERKLVIASDNYPKFLNTGKWLMSFNASLTEVKSAKPYEGKFVGKFLDFAHEKDQKPSPKTKPNRFNPDKPQQVYTILWEVDDGNYKGATVPFEIDYSYFVPQQIVWNDKPVTVVGIKMPKGDQSSRHAKASFGFDMALGLLDRPMKWSDNILPGLYDRAIAATKAGKRALITVEDGYGKAIQPTTAETPNPDEFDLEGFAETNSIPSFEPADISQLPMVEPDPFADIDDDNAASLDSSEDVDDLPWEDAPAYEDEFPN